MQAAKGKLVHVGSVDFSTDTRYRYLIVGFMSKLKKAEATTTLRDVRGHLQPDFANGIFSIQFISLCHGATEEKI